MAMLLKPVQLCYCSGCGHACIIRCIICSSMNLSNELFLSTLLKSYDCDQNILSCYEVYSVNEYILPCSELDNVAVYFTVSY